MFREISGFISATIIVGSLASCGSDSSTKVTKNMTDLEAASAQIVDKTIIPAVQNFLQKTKDLENKITVLCSSKSADDLVSAQDQWEQTANAWYQVLPYNFGPMILDEAIPEYIYVDSHRLRGDDYTSDIRSDIDAMIASSAILNDAVFTNKNFNKLGLLALEIALFETAASQSTAKSDLDSELTNVSRKCAISKGYATQLRNRAQNIEQSWTKNYRNSGQSYRDLLVSGNLESLSNESGTSAAQKIVTSVQEYLNYISQRGVLVGVAKVSGNVWPQLGTSINTINEMVEGSTTTSLSYARLMENGAANDLIALRANLKRAKQSIEEQNSTDFSAARGLLDGNMKRELTDGIGISLGISFSDGD